MTGADAVVIGIAAVIRHRHPRVLFWDTITSRGARGGLAISAAAVTILPANCFCCCRRARRCGRENHAVRLVVRLSV